MRNELKIKIGVKFHITSYHVWALRASKRRFWVPKTPLLNKRGAQTRYEILCPSLFSAHCASFMWRCSLLRRRGGLHILSCDRAFIFPKKGDIHVFSQPNGITVAGKNKITLLFNPKLQCDCVWHFCLFLPQLNTVWFKLTKKKVRRITYIMYSTHDALHRVLTAF